VTKADTIRAIHNENGIVHRFVVRRKYVPYAIALCNNHVVYVFYNVHQPWGWTPTDLPTTCILCAVAPDADP